MADAALVKRMCDAIVHRGPDDEGQYVDKNVGIGMRRLSIIDLGGGHQPMSNEDGTVWIVFNGEIYNHRQLREELTSRGHRFATRADTEAIIHAYEEWGERCPEKLNGMFGFAIWDSNKQLLLLARDRIGIKPLYYYYSPEKFVFASELKSLLQDRSVPRRVDLSALDTFLTFEYIPAPMSIFEGVRKLPAGHTLVWRDGEISVKQYWDVDGVERAVEPASACEELRSLLEDAVRIRLMSDVPLGAFLSGGIDSSSIVAHMARIVDRPVKTFSIGFKDSSYNELEYAREVARQYRTEHYEFILEPDIVELTDKLVHFLDEPFGDFSIFPTYLVSKMARQHVTVVLSGDGGDELFAGYETYKADRLAQRYSRIPDLVRRAVIQPFVEALPPTSKKKGLINKAKRFVEGAQYPEDLGHVRWMIFLADEEKRRLYSHDVLSSLNGNDAADFVRRHFRRAASGDPLNRQLYVDIKTYLVDDILVKVDRMSMATSLEARVPFLDHRVVEFAARLPSSLKLYNGESKWILKQAMGDLLPPKIQRRGKEGFSIPIKNWLKNELRPLMLEVLSPANIKRSGFFDPQEVQRLVDEHLRNVENHSHRLWALMMFGIWHDTYLNS
jgi:asparagine synthase (glutamine-hydrolysing)